jgi:TRAP-type C4-dicarboxylate transport system permease large subunit
VLFAAAIIAAAGALGSLIPPSNLLIIYGLVSDTFIPRLFLVGVLSGIVVTALLMISSYIIARNGTRSGVNPERIIRDFAAGSPADCRRSQGL